MTVVCEKRIGSADKETQDQGMSKKWQDAGFLARSPILTTRMAEWTARTIETQQSIVVSRRRTMYQGKWEIPVGVL